MGDARAARLEGAGRVAGSRRSRNFHSDRRRHCWGSGRFAAGTPLARQDREGAVGDRGRPRPGIERPLPGDQSAGDGLRPGRPGRRRRPPGPGRALAGPRPPRAGRRGARLAAAAPVADRAGAVVEQGAPSPRGPWPGGRPTGRGADPVTRSTWSARASAAFRARSQASAEWHVDRLGPAPSHTFELASPGVRHRSRNSSVSDTEARCSASAAVAGLAQLAPRRRRRRHPPVSAGRRPRAEVARHHQRGRAVVEERRAPTPERHEPTAS